MKYLFPFSTNIWWYATSYIIFLVFYPFFNKALESFSAIELKSLILACLILWCLPSLVPYQWPLGASNTVNFFVLYAIIFYVRKFTPSWTYNNKLLSIVIIGGFFLAFLSIVVFDILGTKISTIANYSCYYIRGNWRAFPMIISIALFLRVAKSNAFTNKTIDTLGGATFGVYLIHMHPLAMQYLFNHLFIIDLSKSTAEIILFVIVVTLTIFICGFIIELFRDALFSVFEKPSKINECKTV